MVDDLSYEGWPECWDADGTHVGSSDPITIRVGIYEPNNDPDAGSIALCTSGGQPILLDERAARDLRELLDWSIRNHRIDLAQRDEWRHAAARDLVGAAVLSREQWNQLMTAVRDGGNADALTEMLTSCAPEGWRADNPASTSTEPEG